MDTLRNSRVYSTLFGVVSFSLIAFLTTAAYSDDSERDAKAKKRDLGRPINCETVYQAQPIRFVIDGEVRDVHRIGLRGVLGRYAALTLDGNTCEGVNEFGDGVRCTKKFYHPHRVTLARLQEQDPAAKHRRLYEIQNDPQLNYLLRLVVPRNRMHPLRLVFMSVDGKVALRVITLESLGFQAKDLRISAVSTRSHGTGAAATRSSLCKHAIYDAQQILGSVIVRARGKHSTSGYRVEFVRLPFDVFPPEFSLWCKRPEGISLPVVTPFVKRTGFRAFEPVDFVTVHDARGAHRVAVRQTHNSTIPNSLLGVARADGSFTIFIGLVKLAQLDRVLDLDGPFTLLAPTDDAFRKLSRTFHREIRLPENRSKLIRLLSRHILSGSWSEARIYRARSIRTWDGQVYVYPEDHAVGLSSDRKAKLVRTNQAADNGILHGLDTVLVRETEDGKDHSGNPPSKKVHSGKLTPLGIQKTLIGKVRVAEPVWIHGPYPKRAYVFQPDDVYLLQIRYPIRPGSRPVYVNAYASNPAAVPTDSVLAEGEIAILSATPQSGTGFGVGYVVVAVKAFREGSSQVKVRVTTDSGRVIEVPFFMLVRTAPKTLAIDLPIKRGIKKTSNQKETFSRTPWETGERGKKESRHSGYVSLINETDLNSVTVVLANSKHGQHFKVYKNSPLVVWNLPSTGYGVIAFNKKGRALASNTFPLSVPFEVGITEKEGHYKVEPRPLE